MQYNYYNIINLTQIKERTGYETISLYNACTCNHAPVNNCAQFHAPANPAFGTAERKLLYNKEATKRLTQAIRKLD